MIKAEIIADSVNPNGKRIVSFICTYPRFIHSEVMTHRLFSRNAASSRAIPVARMISMIEENPAMPVYWGGAQKGMQAGAELTGESLDSVRKIWLGGARHAVALARALLDHGLHKQVANRVLEPWAHMTTLITATEWGNFFNLRAHPDAQPEFQELAYCMLEAFVASTPVEKRWHEWHLPFGEHASDGDLVIETKLKICTARTARLSYLTFDGEFSHEKDIAVHDVLRSNGHMSPFEHCAKAYNHDTNSNFDGWLQYRKTIPNENRTIFDPVTLLAQKRKEVAP